MVPRSLLYLIENFTGVHHPIGIKDRFELLHQCYFLLATGVFKVVLLNQPDTVFSHER